MNKILSKGICGRKQIYENEIDAATAIVTKMKYGEKTADWRSFKVYQCPKCKLWHITKQIEKEKNYGNRKGQ